MVTAEMETSKKSKDSLYEASAVSNFKGNPAENWRLSWVSGSTDHAYNGAYIIIHFYRQGGLQIMNPVSTIPTNSKIIPQLL